MVMATAMAIAGEDRIGCCESFKADTGDKISLITRRHVSREQTKYRLKTLEIKFCLSFV